jgi:hypothetical protein
MARRGRKSQYHEKVEQHLDLVKKLRIDGLTEELIAKRLGVSYRSFMEYKNKYPQLSQTLKESSEDLLAELENTLFKEALGNRNKPDTIEEIEEYDYRTGKMNVVKRTKKYSNKPNITSLIFALKNLNSDKWKDRHESTFTELQSALDNFKLVSDELEKNLNEEDK